MATSVPPSSDAIPGAASLCGSEATGFICACPPGYTGDGMSELIEGASGCRNIDECALPSMNQCDGEDRAVC